MAPNILKSTPAEPLLCKMGSSLSIHSSSVMKDTAICGIEEHIIFRVLDYVDTRTLLNWMATCRGFQATTRKYITKVYDMNIIYRKFFATQEDTITFRKEMAKTGALVSGSQVIQFFSCTQYAESDLDLYVHYNEAEYMAMCLVDLGYKYVPSRSRAIGWSQLCDEACEMAVDEIYRGGILYSADSDTLTLVQVFWQSSTFSITITKKSS